MSSRFSKLPPYQGDPILALMETFMGDPRPSKVSLGIGLYFDEAGRLPVLDAVRSARETLARKGGPMPYLPMEGSAAYRHVVQDLVFGPAHAAVAEERICTVATLGGSGALRVGADFLRSQLGCNQVFLPDPTWDNHSALFLGAGYQVQTYPYYDSRSRALGFDAMVERLQSLPPACVILLHASCHNPTGIDLSVPQWKTLSRVMGERGLIPFIDMAYQGFGSGLDEDAWAVRFLADQGHEFLVANSFSKNFSIYGERAGGLSVVCKDPAAAALVLGQLKLVVRGSYSTPPAHGAALVETILASGELRQTWTDELSGMRQRIRNMREGLHAALMGCCGPSTQFDYLLSQQGMFSYTGLTPTQVQTLRKDHGIYLIDTGRLCISGLTTASIAHVAQAIASVTSLTHTD